MAFADDVDAALAAPLGGPLGRRILAPTVTAIVADAAGGERDAVALAALVAALERAGVPRRRQFVLLAGDATGQAARAHAAGLRASLGIPLLRHDPDGPTCVPGTLPGGRPLALDDELREAEEVVLCGTLATDAEFGVRGGPAAIWPGLADRAGRAAFVAALGGLQGRARAVAALAAAREALDPMPAGFALLWSEGAAPRVVAGETASAIDAAAAWAGIVPRAETPGTG